MPRSSAARSCTPRSAGGWRLERSLDRQAGGGRPRELLRQSYGLIQALAVLAVLVVVMSILSPRFLSWINIANLMGQMAVPLIVAAGMTIVMISGEFDISVGSVVALSAAVSATVMLQYGVVAGCGGLAADRPGQRLAERHGHHQGPHPVVHRDAGHHDDGALAGLRRDRRQGGLRPARGLQGARPGADRRRPAAVPDRAARPTPSAGSC